MVLFMIRLYIFFFYSILLVLTVTLKNLLPLTIMTWSNKKLHEKSCSITSARFIANEFDGLPTAVGSLMHFGNTRTFLSSIDWGALMMFAQLLWKTWYSEVLELTKYFLMSCGRILRIYQQPIYKVLRNNLFIRYVTDYLNTVLKLPTSYSCF